MARELTEKQRRFVEAYMGQAAGNATEAARLAGYSGSDGTLAVTAHELLRNPKVRSAIDSRVADDPKVKTREDLQRWWSAMVDETSWEPKDRLKASELLAKSQAVFVERHEVKHEGAVQVYVPSNERDG